jgi:SAM-dependent methyltransferase
MEFDEVRAARFARRMREVLNGGALTLMTSLGHRTGLFDVMRGMPPSDAATIAARAGLDARYVREWLAAMVSGDFVEYDAAAHTYRLPPEHASALTREARPNNFGVVAQWIPLLGVVEDELVACFAGGGGLSRAAHARIQQIAGEVADQAVVARLLDGVLPLAHGLREALAAGIDVLEIGCGDGRALAVLARAFPKSRFTGWDDAPASLAAARSEIERSRLRNVRLARRHLDDAPRDCGFDLVTGFDVLHAHPRPRGILAAMSAALRPGGLLLLSAHSGTSCLERDTAHPLAPLLYTVSCLHSGPEPNELGPPDARAEIGMMAGEAVVLGLLEDAGFLSVEAHPLHAGDCHLFYFARKRR